MEDVDLKFLKEMRTLSSSLLNEAYDITKLEMLDQMILDWISELERKLNKANKN
jgi:hypothetical protein